MWEAHCGKMIDFMSTNCARTCRFCPGDEFNAGNITGRESVARATFVSAVIFTLRIYFE